MTDTRIEAGASVQRLPLPAGLPLAGYITDHRTALADNTSLEVRSLVLTDAGESIVIVVFDLLYASAGLARRLREMVQGELGIAGERILVAGTHSHCTPRDTTLESDAALVERLAETGRDSVVRAHANRIPVRVVSGTAEDVDIGRSRRENATPLDTSAQLVTFQADDDAVVATVVNLACHPVVLDDEARHYHPDYVGALRSVVEAAVGGTCLMLQGFAGDTNPIVTAHTEWETGRVGARAAGPIVARLADMLSTERSPQVFSLSRHADVSVDVPPGRIHTGPLSAQSAQVPTRVREISVPERPDATESAVAMEGWITAHLQAQDPIFRSMEMTALAGDTITLEVQTLTVGDELVIVTLPGEPLHALRAGVIQHFPGAHVLTVGYANGAPGYLPDRAAYPESGYEVGCSIVEPGTAENLLSAIPDPRHPRARSGGTTPSPTQHYETEK